MIFIKDTLGNIVAVLQNPKQLLSSNDFPKGLILERNKESVFLQNTIKLTISEDFVLTPWTIREAMSGSLALP